MKIIGVTHRKLCVDFYKTIEKICEYKLDYLVLREKDLNDSELENMAIKIKEILSESKIKLIINGNPKVASNVKAYGVQLSFKAFCDRVLDEFSGIMGVSVHTYKEALQAEKDGADYLGIGPIFTTNI